MAGRLSGAVVAWGAVAATVAGCDSSAPPRAGSAPADTASLYAERVMESLGGRRAWDRTRYLAFDWKVSRDGQIVADRHHAWDRYEGRYRVEYDRDGSRRVVVFDVNAVSPHPELGKVPAGQAWADGVPLDGLARDSALARAYRIFINDSYWALMPFKWDDPGVQLAYEGMQTLSDGRAYAVIALSFEPGLGVTEDRYRAFVDPDSGRMAAWQYHLGSSDEPGPVIWWEDWERVGDIRFAMTRRTDGGDVGVFFENVVAARDVPAGAFDPPASGDSR